MTRVVKVGWMGLGLLVGGMLFGPSGQIRVAQAAGKTAPAAKPPPTTTKPIVVLPEGLRWGMTVEEVAKVYDRLTDKDYLTKYKSARITQQPALDAEVQDLKASYRRPIVFGDLPVGIDQTPIRNEYNYKHEESMLTITREGVKRYIFFASGRVYKTYDEVPLKEKEGAGYKEAVLALQQQLGVAGRVLAPDPAHGRNVTEVDWTDGTTHLRALDRSGENLLGLVYEDRSLAERIAAWKATQKGGDENHIDPAIVAVTREGAVNDSNAHAADSFTGKAHADAPAAPPPAAKKK
jgi:hypothetical protein